jgi:Rieske Fe-S protein
MTDSPARQEHHLDTAGSGGVAADRRTVLIGAAVAAGGLTLAACGSSDSGSGSDGSGGSDGGETELALLRDIPDGSALVVSSASGPVVLVREGSTVSGLSAVCTHQGCTVSVSDAELPCPCHGSVFALDGSVLRAPATTPLPAVPVLVVDDRVLLA